jgi:putative phosphoesterase
MRIGVVSDTHGYFDPYLEEVLAGVDVILHAGDVGCQEVLDQLGLIAPVRAISGNVDSADLSLPPSLKLDLCGVQVEIVHILPVPQSELEEKIASPAGAPPPRRSRRLSEYFEETTRAVIFGHSHKPWLVISGGRLFFNPGSAGKKRFSLPRCCGLLKIVPGGIRAQVQLLEKYNGALPEKIQLDFEE